MNAGKVTHPVWRDRTRSRLAWIAPVVPGVLVGAVTSYASLIFSYWRALLNRLDSETFWVALFLTHVIALCVIILLHGACRSAGFRLFWIAVGFACAAGMGIAALCASSG